MATGRLAGTVATAGAMVRACHPEPTAAVTLATAGLAVAAGRGAAAAWVAAAVLSGQLSVGWCNDYLDRGRDQLTGRRDKPLVGGALPPRAVGLAAVAALVAAVPLSLVSGVRAAVVHLIAVASAWSYNLGLKSTAISVAPYVLSFALLPAFVTLGLAGRPWPAWWAMAAGGLLGAGAHLTNALPDLVDDLRTGVRGLPHRLGRGPSQLAAAGLLLAASTLLALGPAGSARGAGLAGPLALGVAAATVVVGLGLDRRAGSRAAFRATLAVAAMDVALLVARGRALS